MEDGDETVREVRRRQRAVAEALDAERPEVLAEVEAQKRAIRAAGLAAKAAEKGPPPPRPPQPSADDPLPDDPRLAAILRRRRG